MPPTETRSASSTAGPAPPSAREREAQGAAILGWFHLALAAPVLIGTAFAELPIDRVLNAGAGVVLALVGGGLLWGSRRIARAGHHRPPPR